jgi:hypothetical protein
VRHCQKITIYYGTIIQPLTINAIRSKNNVILQQILRENKNIVNDLVIDASHIKVHPHAAGAKGGNQEMSRTKGGSTPSYIWPWMRLVCRSEWKVPQRIANMQDA